MDLGKGISTKEEFREMVRMADQGMKRQKK